MDGATFAAELLLIGAALADGDKAAMIQERFDPAMLASTGCRSGLTAIVRKDRQGMAEFLGVMGVNLGRKELAIDAVARTVLSRAVERHSHVVSEADAALKHYTEES